MKTLTDNFNKVYPKFASQPFFEKCVVEDFDNKKSNEDPQIVNPKKFQSITLEGFSGYSFPHELANKITSFASSASHDEHDKILLKNCDGIVLFEKNDQKYLLFCELKSSYSLEEIAKAKEQIVGSLINMNGILSTLQGYNLSEYKILGLIASFEPTDEQLSFISKQQSLKASFVTELQANRVYKMPAYKTQKFYSPLSIRDVDIYYIPVPGRKVDYSVDINTVLKNS